MKFFKNSINNFPLIVFIFASLNCEAQSIIQGSVYDFGSKDPIIGTSILVINKTGTDSKNDTCYTISGLEGKFEIEKLNKGLYDLRVEYLGCYPTIVKNVLINSDTICLNDIPLFQENTLIYESGFVVKKHLWGLFKTVKGYSDVNGVEGTFGNKEERYLKNENWKSDSVLFRLQSPGIILVNYEELNNVW